MSIENLTTNGTVPALYNIGAGVVAIINSTLTGTGAASGIAAITNINALFARNITTTGFLKAIDNQKGGNTTSSATITEFVSHPVLQLFTSPTKSLGLPIKQTPELAEDLLTNWVNVGDYPAQTVTLPNGHVVQDYTNALQQAIDAGKSTVYFGNNSGGFWGTVHVRGNVKRIIGLEAWMGEESGSNGTLIIDNGTAQTVVIEKFSNIYNQFQIIHNSARTAVVKNMSLENVTINSGAGDLFLEDVITDGIINIPAGGNLFARQLNCESLDEPRINNSGNLWTLGLKTERDATAIGSLNGSKTEIIGGFIYANKSTNPNKNIFRNDAGSQFSATVGEWVIRDQPFNPVKETRDGVTKILKYGQAYGRGEGSMLPLYTGYRAVAAAVPSAAPTALRGSAPRYDVTEISWTDNSNNEDGFLIERKIGSGAFVAYDMAFANQTAFRDTLLTPSTTYAYRVKAVNSKGQSAYSNTVTITTLQAPATPAAPSSMATSLTDANILVTWNDNSNNEQGFKLERKVTGVDSDFVQIALLGPDVESYYQVGLLANTTYAYRVRAYFEISNSAYSNTATTTIGAATEPLVHWKFDDLSGTTAGDASRHGKNGTLKNGLSFTTNSVTGVLGKALQLDGSDDYVTGTDDGRYLPAEDYPFTVSAWVKTTDDGIVVHFGDKDRLDVSYTLSVTTAGTAKLESQIGSSIGNVTGPVINNNQWHLLTGVFESATTHRLYVDGVLSATLTGNFPAQRYLTRLTAGAKDAQGSSSSKVGGLIDDVRLYGRALTATEISALYSVFAPTCGTVNIALNKSAVASTYGSSSTHPSKAVDGSLTTRWASARGDNQYIKIDLGTIQSITCMKLEWANDYGASYKVQVSSDNVAWTDVYSTTTGSGGVVNINGLSVSGRYVRMSGTLQGPTANGYSLYEFSVYGSGTGALLAATSISTSTTLEVADLENETLRSNLVVYPNPATKAVTLRFASKVAGRATIELYNSLGQQQLSVLKPVSVGANSINLNLNNTPMGVYRIRVRVGDKIMVQELVVN